MKQSKMKKKLNKYLRKYFAEDLDKVIASRALNDENPGMEILVSASSKIVRVITQFDPSEGSKEKAVEGVSKIVEQMDADAVMTVSEVWASFDSNFNCAPSQDPSSKDVIMVGYCDHNGNEISALAILDENRGIEAVTYMDKPNMGRFSNFFGVTYVIRTMDVQEFITDCNDDLKKSILSNVDLSDIKVNISDELQNIQGEGTLFMRLYHSERKKKAFMSVCPHISMLYSMSMTADAVN